jgi:hypothetical protein
MTVARDQLSTAILNDRERPEAVVFQLPGKGLARYVSRGSVRFQPLPIGTAREVFPQAARPVGFVEKGYASRREAETFTKSLAPSKGWTVQSQYSPRTSYKYSLLHRRHPSDSALARRRSHRIRSRLYHARNLMAITPTRIQSHCFVALRLITPMMSSLAS